MSDGPRTAGRARGPLRTRTAPDLEGFAARSRAVLFRYRVWPTRGFEFVSDAATRLTGYTPEEHYADPDLYEKVIHPEDQPVFLEHVRLGFLRESTLVRWRHRDGRTLWVELRETPIRDVSGRLVAVEGIVLERPDPTRGSGARVRVVNGIRIDLADQVVHVDGKSVHLTPTEFRLLAYLTERPGRVLTRTQLLGRLWGSSYVGSGHACETAISALRRKIERNPRYPERIVTVRGRGYTFAPA